MLAGVFKGGMLTLSGREGICFILGLLRVASLVWLYPVNNVLNLSLSSHQLVSILKADPKSRTGSEVLGKSQVCISRNTADTLGYLINEPGRYMDIARDFILAEG